MADKSTELNDETLERVATAFANAITGDDSGDSEEPDTSAELNV